MPRTLALIGVLLLTAVPGPAGADHPAGRTPDPARPGATLPVVAVRSYRMSGAIRPLLFWIRSERVGEGHIVWRRGDADERAYELLIGSDPEFAPRRLNRWGYLAEEVRGSTGSMLGLISADDQDTLAGVTADGVDQLPEAVFKTIRATVRAGASHAEVSTLGVARPLTLHDVEIGLELMRRRADPVRVRVAPRPAGTRSGFLAAMSELIRGSVRERSAERRTGRLPVPPPVVYVYGDGLHDLTVRSLRFHEQRTVGERTYANVIHGRYETRSRRTGDRRRFEVIYGAHGDLAEVPIWIRYQPRWWLRADLTLDPDEGLVVDAGPRLPPDGTR